MGHQARIPPLCVIHLPGIYLDVATLIWIHMPFEISQCFLIQAVSCYVDP
jgi:hypothetical protein